MISVIFDLINIIPLCMSGALFLFPRDERAWLLYILPVVIPVICVFFLHMCGNIIGKIRDHRLSVHKPFLKISAVVGTYYDVAVRAAFFEIGFDRVDQVRAS